LGVVHTVCEAARNLACTGARPAGITNCLNYGNPERPEIMWQFRRGVEGLRDAALALEVPVVSGNVSFYNETEGRAIPPTPTIAMVGIFDDIQDHIGSHFRFPGDLILMVRTAAPSLAASEYGASFGSSDNELSPLDLRQERRLLDALVQAVGQRLLRSAHDVGDGGLAVALAEACFGHEAAIGANIGRLSSHPQELFGEGASTVIVSIKPENLDIFRQNFASLNFAILGSVTSDSRLRISSSIDESVSELRLLYEEALPRGLGST
jgi:phosphoribosylformylglycinamidine synthase